MCDYTVYCYDNENSTKIYKYENTKDFVVKSDTHLLLVVQMTTSTNDKYINIIKDNLLYDCFKYKQFCKITLICFNENYTFYEVNEYNYNNILNKLIVTGDNISYNKLNNTILNNIIDSNKYELVFLIDGHDPHNENIDESILFLKNVIKLKDIFIKIFLLSENNIINKYLSLVDEKHILIKNTFLNDDIVTNIKYINIFDTDFKLNVVDNKYVLEVFDFLYDKKYPLINTNQIYTTAYQLYVLNETIYNCYNVNDIYLLYNILYQMNKIENIYKEEINKLPVGLNILNNLYYIYEKVYYHYVNNNNNIIIKNIIKLSNISLKNIFMNKYKFKFLKLIIKNINLIKTKDIENININEPKDIYYFNKSKDIFYSVLTISDWIEELENKNIMGLVIRTNSLANISKLGYKSNKILDITPTIIPLKYFRDIFINYYNKNKYLDNGYNVNPMISGNTIGSGNMIFPLYICPENWKICNIYLNSIISLIAGQNPLLYNENHNNIIFKIFFKMICKTFNKNNEYTNDKWLYLLFAVYITCKKIMEEKNINLDGIYYNFIKSEMYRTKQYTISLYTLLGYILLSGLKINNMNLFIKNIIEEKIRREILKYLPKKVQIYNYFKLNNNKIEIDNLKMDNFIKNFDTNKIIDNMMSFNKFYKLIQQLDNIDHKLYNTYSILPDKDLQFIQRYIKNNLNNEISFKILMDNINGYQDNDFIRKCIVQGIEQKNSKIRTKFIKKNYYQNLLKISYNNLIQNIIERYSNEKDMKTINCVINNI